MEAMLADRDETYERFIELEYSYHLQEKTARTGYILHGLHNDDKGDRNGCTVSRPGGRKRSQLYSGQALLWERQWSLCTLTWRQ